MKKLSTYYYLTIIGLLTSCQPYHDKTNENTNKEEIKNEHIVKKPDTLKELDEIKLMLLDARYEKAELLLGKPDIKGRILMGHFYYAFYFNKVRGQLGTKLNLLLLIDASNGLSDRSTIHRVHIMGEGQTVYGAGNNFQELTLSNGELTSNSMDFTSFDGNTDWGKIF